MTKEDKHQKLRGIAERSPRLKYRAYLLWRRIQDDR